MWLKSIIGFSAVAMTVLVVFPGWTACFSRSSTPAASVDQCDIACSLNPQELPARQARVAAFRSSAREITELDNGYAMRFDLDDNKLLEAARLAAAESHCCGFLDFRITVRPSQSLLAIEITGPPGAKKFLAESVFSNDANTASDAAIGELSKVKSCACLTDAACDASGKVDSESQTTSEKKQ